MTLETDKALYLKANKAYNNGESIMKDSEFDTLERRIAKADPKWPPLHKTGAAVGKKVEVRLHEPMPSLAKVYPEGLPKWRAKQKVKRILAMHKLDGSALIARYLKGRCVFLATRGDGELGKDISFLIPYLKLPVVKDKSDFSVRIEAVMKNRVFLKKWKRETPDSKEGFDNPRNAVSGLLNRTKVHEAMNDIDLVVLGVYHQPLMAGLHWADHQGFTTVERAVEKVDSDWIKVLEEERKSSAYDIDGLVLAPPEHEFSYVGYGRPKWTVAFKVNDEENADETTVTDVIWQASRTGRWTPKIEIEPVTIGGAVIRFATAHNAQWMNERKIGVGAVVKIVRSGDVIPKIVGVVKAAAQPSHPPGEFYEKGVHYYATERSAAADVREILHFFTVLGIENIARKGVEKLYEGGFTDVLSHVTSYGRRMAGYTKAGMGEAMTGKIYEECGRVFREDGVTLIKLMNASNCFESFGERKLAMIENHFAKKGNADILRVYVQMKIAQLESEKERAAIESIKGMGKASARQFFEGLMAFKLWFAPIAKTKLIKVINPVPKKAMVARAGKYVGQKVSFTGYRNKDHEAALEEQGAEVISFSAKTTILIYKAGGKKSGKLAAAEDKGIKVCTFEEL